MVKKTTLLIPVIVCSVIIGVLGIIFFPADINSGNHFPIRTIKIDNKIMKVEVANSNIDRERWLMFRDEKLNPDSGLLLIYDKPDLYSMWLINIRYPLDLLWFDQAGHLVYTVKNAQPCSNILDQSSCSYKNINPAKFIFAASSGFIQRNNITDNSRLELL
jgi:uncharacterized membrane protein (UPF0127 family)